MDKAKLLPRDSFIVIVVGPSGAGKDTVTREIQKLAREPFLHMNESHTTRPARPNDPDYYRHVSEQEFQKLENESFFLQTNKAIYGKWYGTPFPKDLPPDRIEAFILFADSAVKVKKYFPKAKIYLIEPPSLAELRRRLQARGETPEDLERRVKSAQAELLSDRKIADHNLVSETGKQREVAQKLHALIKADWQSQA